MYAILKHQWTGEQIQTLSKVLRMVQTFEILGD